MWHDDTDCENAAGIYRVFRDRGKALDYAAGTVMERARNLGVPVLDSDGWKRRMTKAQVRDQLGSGMAFQLVGKFDEFGSMKEPCEWVSVFIEEVEVEVEAET